MKKENPFLNFIKKLNIKEEKKDKNFNSMKELFHFPSKQVKSQNLLNYFSSKKEKNNGSNREYSVILNE